MVFCFFVVLKTGVITTAALSNQLTKRTNQALGHIYHKKATEAYKCPIRRDVVVSPNTWTTTDRKATIEWKAKEDGAVYCIWLPNRFI